jgi:hypothetical protein
MPNAMKKEPGNVTNNKHGRYMCTREKSRITFKLT